ncbi:MAG: ABC transporter substrate-binding protein [Paracoccaceae bacterium]
MLSNLDPVPEDLGLAGAQIALQDIRTTGAFLGHDYSLSVVSVPPGGDLAAAAAALDHAGLVLVDADAAALLAVADLPQMQGALLFNTSAGDAGLRSADCRANLLHTVPETAARSDALMQVLQKKQWSTAVMITGAQPADRAFAAALRGSAAKFGVTIAAEREWTFDTDLRDSTMDEVPRFLQDMPGHDVVLVADETDDFGRYIEHNTWLPRPVAGSDGLVPTAWSAVIESWGAVQLQNRFEALAGRDMRGQDYAAWAAIRAIGEAVTRTGSADPAVLRAHLLGPGFQMDGFKGRPLSFRPWNGQLRMPIAVVNARALVTLAPVEGYLHPVSEMDTLGLDAPESACTAFAKGP